MSRPARIALLVLALGALLPPALATEETVESLGRPKQFGQGKYVGYALWYEDGLWRLRATGHNRPKAPLVVFTGSVRVQGDRVIGNFQALEKNRKLKLADFITPHNDQKGFDFKFAVMTGVDGVDFKGAEKAETIKFKLLVDGDDNPKRIMIGAKGENPSKAEFILPARPTK